MGATMPDRNMTVKNKYSMQELAFQAPLGHTSNMGNIKHLREARGLTQLRLAEMVGVNQAYISKMEAGTANPTLDKIMAVAAALGAEPAELFALPALKQRVIAALGAMDSTDRQEAALIVLEAMARHS